MATDSIWGPISIPASADLRAYQFRFFRINSSGQLALPTLGGTADTVLQDTPTAQGQPGQCCRAGDITKVQFVSGITAGNYVSTDATGQGIVSVSGDFILGKALDTVVGAGIGRVHFGVPGGRL